MYIYVYSFFFLLFLYSLFIIRLLHFFLQGYSSRIIYCLPYHLSLVKRLSPRDLLQARFYCSSRVLLSFVLEGSALPLRGTVRIFFAPRSFYFTFSSFYNSDDNYISERYTSLYIYGQSCNLSIVSFYFLLATSISCYLYSPFWQNKQSFSFTISICLATLK